MIKKISIHAFSSLLFICVLNSCQNSSNVQAEKLEKDPEANSSIYKPVAPANNEPHRYGGWYCPDNFGFVPVDIQKLKGVPVIADRLPTKQELQTNMSLIDVDIIKYPDARALKMNLPRVARIYSDRLGINELIIVIQAIVVQNDTIVGYRFANGGNGSARIREVTFLSNDEVTAMGSQPFYYSKSVLKASIKNIWKAMSKTDYFKQLGQKFNKQEFFTSEWNSKSEVQLSLDTNDEKAAGFVGMVFGNYYLHIDYDRNGFHYSEKLLMIENQNDHTTEFFFASGPFPKDFEKRKSDLDKWLQVVKKVSEAN
jgi:hypothetical protein